MLVLLKRFSGNVDIEKARAKFERAKKSRANLPYGF
jgi:hypothetical protein